MQMQYTLRLTPRPFRSPPSLLRCSPIRIPNKKPSPSVSLLLEMSSWSCTKCTFLNPPSQKSSCQICLSSVTSKWSCKACTFLNPYNNSECELCRTRAPVSSLSNFEDLKNTEEVDGELDSSVGSVLLPLQRCNKRKVKDDPDPVGITDDCVEIGGFNRGIKAFNKALPELGDSSSQTTLTSLTILSYNVWFREDLELCKRMEALGDLIQLHSPDIVCFQEVTPNIFQIFQKSGWWKVYRCSISNDIAFSRPYFCMQLSKLPVKSFSQKPFVNSIMGRELCVAELELHKNIPLIVATTHLESPCPAPPKYDQMYSKERVQQAKEAVDLLKRNRNVIFCGDMNWDDKMDGQFPLPDGWVDAWPKLRPGADGWTYDTKSNLMLSSNNKLQKRLDRFVCNLQDFEISSIDMIGMEAIPGLSYIKEKKVRKEIKMLELPVLPSDHYGLLLTLNSL